MNRKGILLSETTWHFVISILIVYMVLFCLNLLEINVDVVGITLYLFFLLHLARKHREIIIKYVLMFVVFTYHLGSVVYVDNYTTFLYNLQRSTYRIGAFIPLLGFYLFGYVTLILLEENKNSNLMLKVKNAQITNARVLKTAKTFGFTRKQQLRIVTLTLFVLMAYMLLRIKDSGYYSMGGIDRFEYRNKVFSLLDSKLYTYIAWVLPIPLIGSNFGMKKRAAVFFAIYVFYLIWVGDKFGSLFSAFYFYFLATWATRILDRDTFRKLIVLVIVVLALLMLYIAYQVLYERGSIAEIGIYFNHRLTGGQSDLWWGIYDLEREKGWRVLEFGDELKAMFVQPESAFDYNFGIYKMMNVAAPSAVVYSYISRGIRFAASTQASLFYYFKFTGLFIGGIVLFAMFFFIVNQTIIAYKTGDIIGSICYTMLLSKAIYLVQMSGVDMIGNTTTILGIIILLLRSQKKEKDPMLYVENRICFFEKQKRTMIFNVRE